MSKKIIDFAIRNEEQRTLKWFLTLFYVFTICYDFFYFYVYPNYVLHKESGFKGELWYVFYIFLIILLPTAYYLNKKNLSHYVKYIYFISFIIITVINDVVTYIDQPEKYESGNAVEFFWLLLSPIFVNKHFFWIVSLGLIFKYLLEGLIIQTPVVFFPIVIFILLSIIAFILLIRFKSYVSVIQNSYDQQIQGMVKGIIATLELKDPYTRGHSERVAQYAMILAEETKEFSQDELKSFNYACLLHDIGKINISDQILMKPTNLTKEEYEIVKTHPVVGAEAVKDVNGLECYISVIRSHHERWDGQGYPDQLLGKETPLLARIVSVADAFDAMTSSRSYRAALPLEEAYNRINEGSDKQFDPELVYLFRKIFPKWKEMHFKYTEDIINKQ